MIGSLSDPNSLRFQRRTKSFSFIDAGESAVDFTLMAEIADISKLQWLFLFISIVTKSIRPAKVGEKT